MLFAFCQISYSLHSALHLSVSQSMVQHTLFQPLHLHLISRTSSIPQMSTAYRFILPALGAQQKGCVRLKNVQA